jgi:hypothetical protein
VSGRGDATDRKTLVALAEQKDEPLESPYRYRLLGEKPGNQLFCLEASVAARPIIRPISLAFSASDRIWD